MEAKFWKERWKEGRHGFHKSEVHPALLRWAPDLLAEGPKNLLVPLAGKSLDVDWLAREGHQVTAIELSVRAVQQFHEENQRVAKTSSLGSYQAYNSERCRYLVGDVFDANPELLGTFDLIWDRAALVALDRPRRIRYAPLLCALLSPGGILLLNTFRSPRLPEDGPPHSIEEHEVMSLFGEHCTIELLESENRIDQETRWRDMGLTYWITSTWKLTRR